MKIMKKVLFTATVDSHILQFHIPYLKMLKEKGYEVHVATNGTENIPYCDVKHMVSFERSPIKINNLKAIKQLKKIIDKEKFEIIHCHTPMGSVVTRLAAKKARKEGTKVIYTAHGFHFYKGAPLINWMIFYPIEKYLSQYTDCLITINDEDYTLARKKFKKCKQIELIYGVGVDENKFNLKMTDQEKHELRKSLGLRDDDFVLIEVGELNKNKNQIIAIEAMRNLVKVDTNIHLLLVGTGVLEESYKEKIEKYNLKKNIHMLGYRDDIPKLLKISNILLSLSHREGLPVNVIEGMICELPIIATDCRGNRDLVDETIKPDDTSALEKNILKELKSKEKTQQYNIKPYLLKSISKQIEEIYYSLFNKSIIMLRSTEIINDSRIQKEALAFKQKPCFVNVIGWDREKKLHSYFRKNNINIELFRKKSTYGSGMKNLLKLFLFQLFLYKTLLIRRKSYDIIFAADLDTGIVARIISRLLHKKLIYDIYDYYIDCHNLPSITKRIAEKQEIKTINYASVTIICTEQRKEQIKKANPNNLLVIHNSPEISKEMLEGESIIQSNSDKIKIVYVGILQDDRLLIEIGEKIKTMPQYELHIGGFGKYGNYFKNLSQQYDNVFFYGMLEYEKVLKLESECDILFATYNPKVANHRYSAPNKLYEAMALGKPIIVCKNTGVDEIVNKEEMGKTIEYNLLDFFKALIEVEHKNYENVKKTYEQMYDWKIMKNKLMKTIE